MSIYNLTNQPISSSFQPLLQIDSGSAVRDGSGSLVDNLIVTASFALTASFAENAGSVQTGSLLTTASFDNGTRDLTFTKGDSSTFLVNIPGGSGSFIPSGVVSGSSQITELGFLTTSSFNDFTQSNDSKVNSLIAETGSYATTGSNNFIGNQTITGSLALTNNFSISQSVVQANNIILANGGQLRILSPDTPGSPFFNMQNGALQFSENAGVGLALERSGVKLTPTSINENHSIALSPQPTEFFSLNFTPYTGSCAGIVYNQTNDNNSPTKLLVGAKYSSSFDNTLYTDMNFFSSGSAQSLFNLSNTYTNPQTITDDVTIPTGLNGLIVGETTIVGDYTIEGNSEVYVFTPPELLDTGSFATTGSNEFIGDQTITGSLNVKEIINLEPQATLPTGSLGDLAVSGSELYFNDGVNWREVNLT